MKYNPDIHKRRSIRLKEYKYSNNGAYFVTVCVQNRESLFGDIINNEMVLNAAGHLVELSLGGIPNNFPGITIDQYVIMPNHCHAIICINLASTTTDADPVRAGSSRPVFFRPVSACPDVVDTDFSLPKNQGGRTPPLRRQPTLGQIIGHFKYQSTKNINQLHGNAVISIWQRNYYERVIRDENELARAREYIINNPLQWNMDKENPINARKIG
ncbi:MAG: hypothetical protein A2511_10150 [Deltaproteobacteria bacterium RIFOXYD12_FULL_50_9]|nr:MAG: hypothetical protein A2511_10150 [Deltaproteobacteria bacterium RIFOXYD12_FULL_50_9]